MIVQTSGKNQYSYIYILNIFLCINKYIFFLFDCFAQLLNATHLLVLLIFLFHFIFYLKVFGIYQLTLMTDEASPSTHRKTVAKRLISLM